MTVDYEYAEDVHFELDFASWLAIQRAAGMDGVAEPPPDDLKDVLLTERYSVFENELIRLQLPYRKLAFY